MRPSLHRDVGAALAVGQHGPPGSHQQVVLAHGVAPVSAPSVVTEPLAREPLAELFQQCGRLVEAPLRVGLDVGQRVGGVDAGGPQPVGVEGGASAHGDDGYASGGGRRGHAGGGLAVQGLLVEGPLPRDDQVVGRELRQCGVEADEVEQQVDPGADARAEHRDRAEPDTASGTGSRVVPVVAAGDLLDEVGPVRQRGVELRHLVGRRALLRSVDRRGAALAEQRVVDVGRDGDGDALHPAAQGAEVEAVEVGQRGAAVGKVVVVRVEQPAAERGHHPGAPVGARAAADAEDDLRAAGVEGRADDLAQPAARRSERLAPATGEPPEPGHVGHLDDRGLAATRIRRRHRLARGSGRADRDPLEAGGDRRVHRPVAAVRDRDGHDGGVRHPADAGAERGGDLGGGQRPLELVGGDEDGGHDGGLASLSRAARWRSGRRGRARRAPRTRPRRRSRCPSTRWSRARG